MLFDSLESPTIQTSGQGAAPASRSRTRARGAEYSTLDIFGQHGSHSSASAALQSSLESRLRAAMASSGSTLFRLTWNDAVTPSGRRICCAAGVGAPHQRQRLYFVAYAHGEPGRLQLRPRKPRRQGAQAGRGRKAISVADTDNGEQRRQLLPWDSSGTGPQDQRDGRTAVDGRPDGGMGNSAGQRGRGRGQRATSGRPTLEPSRSGDAGELEHPSRSRGRRNTRAIHREEDQDQDQGQGREARRLADVAVDAGATRGFWSPADWVLCRDPSGGPPVARAVEPGTFPLAHGVRARVGLLSGYGNAIVPQVAATFILASLDAITLATGNADGHDAAQGDLR